MNQLDTAYRQGRQLIDERLRTKAHLSSFDLFRSCWSLIEERQELFKGRAELAHYPERAWRTLVYNDFIRHFSKGRPDFAPPVRSFAYPAGAAIAVTVHTGLELGIVRALTSAGKMVSVIYLPAPQNEERRSVFKPGERVQFIKADRDCLLRASMALRNRRVILADCDHPLPENPNANSVRGISRALFEFASRSRTELHFILPYVDQRGHIDFRHRSMGVPQSGGQDLRLEFIGFLNASGINWMRWELV